MPPLRDGQARSWARSGRPAARHGELTRCCRWPSPRRRAAMDAAPARRARRRRDCERSLRLPASHRALPLLLIAARTASCPAPAQPSRRDPRRVPHSLSRCSVCSLRHARRSAPTPISLGPPRASSQYPERCDRFLAAAATPRRGPPTTASPAARASPARTALSGRSRQHRPSVTRRASHPALSAPPCAGRVIAEA